MKLKRIILVAALICAAPAFAFKGDAEVGKTRSAACAACHGVDGNSVIPVNPSIAGQNYTYLTHVLKDYRSGNRKNPIMNGIAAALTDDDIANLAKYFSTQPGKLVDIPKAD